ncbi:murein DD-endopeptidase [Gammaproteobacteria bacterium]|nr:peptidoglycan DD-metalloendopeptidase family protein [Gammaproteobacteria bacterium]CAG0942415.1 murein DD-endopeptidase [Gammaproteobacteria bacterium]
MTRPSAFLRGAAAHAISSNGRSRRLPWFATGLGLPLLSMGFLLPDAGYQNALRLDLALTEVKPVFTLPLLFNSSDLVKAGEFGNPDIAADGNRAVTVKVRRGDTLDRIFRRENLDPAQLAAVMAQGPAREGLRVLRPGDELHVRHDGATLLEISRKLDTFHTLNVIRAGDGFEGRVTALEYQTRTARATGDIRSSLFEAAARAGVSDSTIMKLAAIFASQIDFVLDLREGDHFAVVYEEMWHDGDKLDEGEVLAAEFVSQGKTHRAVRYQAADGRVSYYTPDGRSLRKAFVRAPLAFTRVSSDFNPRRMHPILNKMRGHTGVDYAAPAGTPVRAPGDGRVSFAGRKGGYGNAIILEHGNGVTTLYGHLSRFAQATAVGRRVHQGDVIGFVGATGLATGPHLHYEYRVNGKYMNPRTVKLPEGSTAIDARERPRFAQAVAPLIERLDAGHSMLADGKTPASASDQTT